MDTIGELVWPSERPLSRNEILALVGCLVGTHCVLHLLFRGRHPKPGYLGFECIAGVVCLLLSYQGVMSYVLEPYQPDIMVRMYQPTPWAQRVVESMFVYQVYDIFASVVVAEVRTFVLFFHHTLTITLALCALHPFAHGYAPFFFGIVEISSFLLGLLDIYDINPDWDRRNPIARAVTQGLFVVAYVVIRLIVWPYLVVLFWIDMYSLVALGACHSYVVFGLFAVGCGGLTYLQFMWGAVILSRVRDAIFPAKAGQSAEEKKSS